jgi:hypothetical protein
LILLKKICLIDERSVDLCSFHLDLGNLAHFAFLLAAKLSPKALMLCQSGEQVANVFQWLHRYDGVTIKYALIISLSCKLLLEEGSKVVHFSGHS